MALSIFPGSVITATARVSNKRGLVTNIMPTSALCARCCPSRLRYAALSGGSVTAEVGGATYAIVGWGRTNLRDYYNLNFDPNDAVTVGLGTRAIADTELSLYTIKDDRLGTGQRVTHLLARRELAPHRRLTLDLFYKSGQSTADNYIAGSGLTATYDFEPWFVRLGFDPYVNFSQNQMTLFALGRRF